jgi:hypothetical protein
VNVGVLDFCGILNKLCLAITCNDPQTIFNGHIESLSNDSSLKYSIGSTVRFRCLANLTLRGSRESKCQINGSWAPTIPKCESLY